MQTTQAGVDSRSLAEKARALATKHRELLLYGLIGGTSVVIDFGVFLLLHTMSGVHELLAHAASVSAAVLFSFTMNAKYNFKTTDRIVARFATFVAVSAVGFVIGAAVIWGLVQFAVAAEIAKLISLPVVAGVQFVLNSRVTFAEGAR